MGIGDNACVDVSSSYQLWVVYSWPQFSSCVPDAMKSLQKQVIPQVWSYVVYVAQDDCEGKIFSSITFMESSARQYKGRGHIVSEYSKGDGPEAFCLLPGGCNTKSKFSGTVISFV